MKRTTKNYQLNCDKAILIRAVSIALTLILATTVLRAQSGNWDGSGQVGTTGYTDHGNGVIQLHSTASTGCAGAAVHETSNTYNPTTDGAFNQCYEVFFGCPLNDEIGSDTKGDGMAFSFWEGPLGAYNINNGLACGGGLGYMGSVGQMITIEFDTWSSEGNVNFDNAYEGSGTSDQIAIHVDGDAAFTGKLFGASNPPNLEDGLEHTVCISYDPSTDIMDVTIDGSSVLTYDFTGSPYELETYFGSNSNLNQTWSSGKFGATNPATVSHGQDITDQIGGSLCPANVVITSPSNNASFSACSGPITIEASATPPAGNTIDFIEFFVDGVSIGTDNTAPYSIAWSAPGNGTYTLTAEANYVPSGTSDLSDPVDISVGGGLLMTSTAPTIDGTAETLWDSYGANDLNCVLIGGGGTGGADLQASFKTMWDATNLYFFVTVTDDNFRWDSSPANSWQDDKIEIYVDYGNDKPSGSCCYPGWAPDDQTWGWVVNSGAHGGNVYFDPGNTTGAGGIAWAEGAIAGGYTFEISIPWTRIGGGPPSNGDFIGIEVQVNDDDDGGGRDAKIGWSDCTDNAWQDPSTWGTMQISDCDPLPVELLTFTGQKIHETVVLNWTTVVEINNEKFIIERSTNLTDWEAIGEVAGAGNASVLIDYNFIDLTPPNGTVYYRLHQVDFDGTDAYSNVVVINTKSNYLSITPNPFVDTFTINTNSSGSMDVFIHDVLGRLLFQAKYEVNGEAIQVQPDLPSGAYLVTIKGEGFVAQEKLVKR